MEKLISLLSGILMPALLIICGILFAARQRFFFILHPVRFVKDLKAAHDGGGVSPLRALSQALAGTLGVGNMAGVASAVSAGGAGAVFWMWISALCAMSLKYAEVYLGVKYRRKDADGYFGGAMYYINDTFKSTFPRAAPVFGGIFAVLCLANSLITGNIIQMKAAASVFEGIPPLILGGVLAAAAFITAAGSSRKVSAVTSVLIPFLTLFYTVISLWIIISHLSGIPSVIREIFTGAFSLQSVGGGVGGYAVSRAVRYGVTRGIFSNEAGVGTSPSAHACAHTKSPHHQGCFGIFEVFADTIVLCTMSAFVILLADGASASGLDSIPMTLYAYSSLLGSWAGSAVGVSVILFAFATLICQNAYGSVALKYLGIGKAGKYTYLFISAACSICGTVIAEGAVWQAADLIVSLMTVINIICLVFAARRGMV